MPTTNTEYLRIDRDKSAARLNNDIETLASARYSRSEHVIQRYAYTLEYRNTLDYFINELSRVGFEHYEDAVGNLVARNCSTDVKAFALGSHCDSNRNGGKYDGTLGVAVAVEVCRLNHEHDLGLPLQVISFLEEEGSGFGQMLLGSRIVAQQVTDDDLRTKFKAIDDERSFYEHAKAAGYEPDRWKECKHILDDVRGWVETHIEQGRVLEENGCRLGLVENISGYVHADVTIQGRSDHAGTTPMDMRQDAGIVAAECMLELERQASASDSGVVCTVGELTLSPGLINAVPGQSRFSLDIRGVVESDFNEIARHMAQFSRTAASSRGMTAEYGERQSRSPVPLDDTLTKVLTEATATSGERYLQMNSGAAHDTMSIAHLVPSALVFIPCAEGISHSPEESAKPADAAVAVEVVLNALRDLRNNA